MSRLRGPSPSIEWPTLGLVGLCYATWAVGTTLVAGWSVAAGILVTGLALALHSSLSHEVLHGHPFRSRRLSEALVFPAVGLFVPYIRFRDTHLAHHEDSILTDPYDDPESNYLDPDVWDRLAWPVRAILKINNTLLGRIVIGPAVGLVSFVAGDIRLIRAGSRRVMAAWTWHALGLVPVGVWLAAVAQMPLWAYVAAAYMGMSLLKIRTFLEHQAHEKARGRTVIIEDRGPLALLFLNNNLHVVHHMHPAVPWYRLRRLYAANRARYLARNEGYVYRSYAEIFRRYLWAPKDPVPHPIWRRRGTVTRG